MKNLFAKGLKELMHSLDMKWILRERFGKDIGELLFSFLKETPKPWYHVVNPTPSPWDWLQEPDDYISLPLFAP